MQNKKKLSLSIHNDNVEIIKAIAKQEKRSISSMVDAIVSDATSGELIKKTSVKEFLKANPKATHEQIITYFNL